MKTNPVVDLCLFNRFTWEASTKPIETGRIMLTSKKGSTIKFIAMLYYCEGWNFVCSNLVIKEKWIPHSMVLRKYLATHLSYLYWYSVDAKENLDNEVTAL